MSQDIETRIEQTTLMLAASCREAGFVLSGDQRVSECVAAELLGISKGSLRNMRNTWGTAPKFYRTPVDGSRISYRISDLAEWIETQSALNDI